MKKLTIIVPCYNEAATVERLYAEVTAVLTQEEDIKPSFLFIDDGSTDNTAAIIEKLAQQHSEVKYISFSRNFGKESAMYAGLQHAAGDYVVIMDADLQDPPALLPEMLHAIEEEGYDCVGSRRVTRKGEPPIRSFFARQFYKLINKTADVPIVDGARDFQMMTRKVADAVLSVKEYNRFSKGIFGWVGFKRKWLEYENVQRAAGETKWSFSKLFLYAIQGITSFSSVPLVVSSVCGIICFALALLMLLLIIVRTLIFGDPTSGWPSLVCIILLLSGIQMFFIGILGQYLAKVYLETKDRPKYIIDETNIEKEERL